MTSKFNLIESIVTSSGERGKMTFSDGTRAYWEVDGPYYILHTNGQFTKEYTEDRKKWNENPLTPYAEYLELAIPEGIEPEMRVATAKEDAEINLVINEQRWPGENHQVRRIDAMWARMKMAINRTGINGQHADWAEALDQIEEWMRQTLESERQ